MHDKLFDGWAERYDRWFETPAGKLVKKFEEELILEFLEPQRTELILDAGCGTGVFTIDILRAGAGVVGIDVSAAMLRQAVDKAEGLPLSAVTADMMTLPFSSGTFDKVVSITAMEFIADAPHALSELFRVVKKRGHVVVATLNSLGPWAERRKAQAEEQKNSIFRHAIFRSPGELLACSDVPGVVKTAIHFSADDTPEHATAVELQGRKERWQTGAFVAACWRKL